VTRANAGHRLLGDATPARVLCRRRVFARRSPVRMGTAPQDALRNGARRLNRLLWLNSLEVLSKALVFGIDINGESHCLPKNCQDRLNPSLVRLLHRTAQAGHLIHPGIGLFWHKSPTGSAKAHIAHAHQPKQGNCRKGRGPRRPSGLYGAWRRYRPLAIATGKSRAIATRQTQTVLTTTMATNGISPLRMGLLNAPPHPEVAPRNRCPMGMRVQIRCQVEVDTRM